MSAGPTAVPALALGFRLAIRGSYIQQEGKHVLLYQEQRKRYHENYKIMKAAPSVKWRYFTSTRGLSTSSSNNNAKSAPRKAVTTARYQPKTSPNILNNSAPTQRQKPGESSIASQGPITTPTSLSSTQHEPDKIYVLTHFQRPPPVLIRGIRQSSLIDKIRQKTSVLRTGQKIHRSLPPGYIPVLGQDYRPDRRIPLSYYFSEHIVAIVFLVLGAISIYSANRTGRLNPLREALGLPVRQEHKIDGNVSSQKSSSTHEIDGDRTAKPAKPAKLGGVEMSSDQVFERGSGDRKQDSLIGELGLKEVPVNVEASK